MYSQVYIKRKENKLKQSDAAYKIGISKQSYYLKENGKRDFTITEAKRLARFYGCTLNDLFEDGMHAKKQTIDNNEKIVKELTIHLEAIIKILKSKK